MNDLLDNVNSYTKYLNENENCFFNFSDYLESSNDIFFTDFLRSLIFENEYQSEKSFINNIKNFNGLNILSLNINSLPSKFDEVHS